MLRNWQESDPCAAVNDMILHGFLTVPFPTAFQASFHIITILPNALPHDDICCIT